MENPAPLQFRKRDTKLIHDFSTVHMKSARVERYNVSQKEASAFPAVI